MDDPSTPHQEAPAHPTPPPSIVIGAAQIMLPWTPPGPSPIPTLLPSFPITTYGILPPVSLLVIWIGGGGRAVCQLPVPCMDFVQKVKAPVLFSSPSTQP